MSDQDEELTIEEVTEYAAEFGHQLGLFGDTYGLSNNGVIFAVGTLEEIYCLLESAEEHMALIERLSPFHETLH